jgi:membrane protein
MPPSSASPEAARRDGGDTEGFEPGETGAGRRRTGRHLIGPVMARTWHKLFEDRIRGMAAEAGFWAIVSLPSLLLILLGAIGYLRGVLGEGDVDQIHDQVLRAARDVLTPSTVNADVAPLVNQVLARGHLEVISVGFLISLWAGSAAMSDYVNTITVAYGMRGLRSAWRSRLVATVLYLCFVAAGVVLLPALAIGPDILSQLAPNRIAGTVSLAGRVLYWPVVGLLSLVLLTTLYRLALPVRVRWRRGLPGAVLAMALWLVFSFSLRAYLTSSLRAHSAYGSLAAPIAALLFFYVTALAVLIGAELNSAIDYVSPVPTTAAGRARARLRAEQEESGG